MRCELLVERETRYRRAKSARKYGLRRAVYTVRPGALSTAPAGRFAAVRGGLTRCDGLRLIAGRALVCASPASGDAVRLQWPLRPPPAVVRAFDAPSPNWNARPPRAWTWSGGPASRCTPRVPATVVYAGTLAGRQLVSLAHPGRFAHQLRAGAGRGAGRAAGDRRRR